eukprot:Opistho-2@21778
MRGLEFVDDGQSVIHFFSLCLSDSVSLALAVSLSFFVQNDLFACIFFLSRINVLCVDFKKCLLLICVRVRACVRALLALILTKIGTTLRTKEHRKMKIFALIP